MFRLSFLSQDQGNLNSSKPNEIVYIYLGLITDKTPRHSFTGKRVIIKIMTNSKNIYLQLFKCPAREEERSFPESL